MSIDKYITVNGTITKSKLQNQSQYVVKSVDGLEYKIVDFDLLLDGARVGDYCSIIIDRNPEYQNYKLVDLLDFNRPFTKNQLLLVVSEIKGFTKRNVDQLVDVIGLDELISLIREKKWASIVVKLTGSVITNDNITKLIRQFCHFEAEISNFVFLKVTNFLNRYDKCQLNDLNWRKCRKLISLILRTDIDYPELIEIIKFKPYSLILNGQIKATPKNFIIIDQIAKYGPFAVDSKLWSLENLDRQYAGIWTALLHEVYDNQNCFLYLDRLRLSSAKILGKLITNVEQQFDKLAIYQITIKNVTKKIVFPVFIDRMEKFVVEKLIKLTFDRKLTVNPETLTQVDSNLDSSQIDVINRLIDQGFGIITGPPGVGKTRVISALTNILFKLGEKIILTAPTGLACKNIARNVLPECKIYTIAKLLYRKNESNNNNEEDSDEDNYQTQNINLSNDIENITLLEKLIQDHQGIIVDESSMVDIEQFAGLLAYLPTANFRIILVGDNRQLPSVGPGQVLTDLIISGLFPYHNLTTNYRQQQGSQIITNAIRVTNGISELTPGNDFKMIQTVSDQGTIDLLIELINHLKNLSELETTIILTPFSKKGLLASNNLNRIVRDYFNPDQTQSWNNYALGDRVMQMKNVTKKQIVNGDVGRIIEFKFANRGQLFLHLVVEYQINQLETIQVKYTASEVREQLTLAYVISIHKSQGNGYPCVILLLPQRYNPQFLNRNMFYTAITRAKNILYLIGGDHSDAVKLPLKSRNTRLWSRIKKTINKD